jgi:hypothetical protein
MKKPNEQLLREIRDALAEAIDCWETPDSPEAFCFAMKHLMNLKDRIDAILQPGSQHEKQKRVV